MSFENFRQNIERHIQKTGFSIICVSGGSGRAGFCYTIGLSDKYGHEILVFGLPPEHAMPIINHVASSPAFPALDVPLDEYTNLPVMFKRCTLDLADLHEQYVCQADNYYGRPVEVVQMILSDRNGRLPGHAEFDQEHMGRIQRLFCVPPLLC